MAVRGKLFPYVQLSRLWTRQSRPDEAYPPLRWVPDLDVYDNDLNVYWSADGGTTSAADEELVDGAVAWVKDVSPPDGWSIAAPTELVVRIRWQHQLWEMHVAGYMDFPPEDPVFTLPAFLGWTCPWTLDGWGRQYVEPSGVTFLVGGVTYPWVPLTAAGVLTADGWPPP